jgi:tetratricopeptide (TPR) repeat protein
MRNPFSRFSKRARANRANARARDLDRQGLTAEAISEYSRACGLDPNWSVPFYNLGLVYKYAREWELSLRQNQRATELDVRDVAARWNLGIAATALGRWDVARSAWRGAGVSLPDGEGPVDYPCGRSPIRLNPEAKGEVVWADRLDPARALIKSIPLPDSGFRFGDVVLNDGAPKGYRKLDGVDVPVFDCLDILQPSSFSTCVAEISLGQGLVDSDQSPIDLLVELANERQLAVEDWTKNLRTLCKACSEGRPDEDHEHVHERSDTGGSHRIAIAILQVEQARALLDDWILRSGGATITAFEVAVLAAPA